MASTVDELLEIYSDFSKGSLNWDQFGSATQSQLEKLIVKWGVDDIEAVIKIQDVWERHPKRYQRKSPCLMLLLPNCILHVVKLCCLFCCSSDGFHAESSVSVITPVQDLYELSVSQSSVKSDDIKAHQLDNSYYSPCSNAFVLMAHMLAFGTLPDASCNRLRELISCTHSDLIAAMNGSDPLGYCSQKHLKEEGITALLTANMYKCFMAYCQCHDLSADFADRVSIMHQSILATKAGKGDMDIALFYRFWNTDHGFIHQGFKVLYPLLFIEFTKTSTKSVDKKLPQAALYANHLFRLMHFDKERSWVPLLGIVMSEHELLLRLYSPSIVNNHWKVAEIDVWRDAVTPESLHRLVHVMAGWATHCTGFLCSPSASTAVGSLNAHLMLRKHSNVVKLGNKIFKCYDYRELSERAHVHLAHRRAPDLYFTSGITGIERVVDWSSYNNPADRLQIISYNLVDGDHRPSCIGHFFHVLRKLRELHSSGVAHGDVHFHNVIFSRPNESAVITSTIIDYDYSGLADEKTYPPQFNTEIKHGYRHPGAVPGELLRVEHDIAAVAWMCAQYQPKRNDLKAEWLSCVADLEEGLSSVIDRLSPHEQEEIEETSASNRAVTAGFKGTGSPDTKRTHYD